MNAREQARFDAFKGSSNFGINHADDFKPGADGKKTRAQELFDALGTMADGDPATARETVLGKLIRAVKDQEAGAGDYHGGTTSKSVQRDGIMTDLRNWNRSAAAIATAHKTPEIMDNFRMPHGTNDIVIAARARAFAEAAEPLKAGFLALAHPANFIEALRQRVTDFEAADSDQGGGLADRAGATASIGSLIDEGLVILKQLDATMHNKYAGAPEKLEAWLTASNIRRPSANGKQPTPTAVPTATPTPVRPPQLATV